MALSQAKEGEQTLEELGQQLSWSKLQVKIMEIAPILCNNQLSRCFHLKNRYMRTALQSSQDYYSTEAIQEHSLG